MNELFPRELCCHEAGHAVVAFSLDVPILAIWCTLSDKGWKGDTKPEPGVTDRLPYMDQVTILRAGKTAEDFFNCPAHEEAWRMDLFCIYRLLDAHGEPHSRIGEADERARDILGRYRERALKLIGRLAVSGRIEQPEFEHLMR